MAIWKHVSSISHALSFHITDYRTLEKRTGPLDPLKTRGWRPSSHAPKLLSELKLRKTARGTWQKNLAFQKLVICKSSARGRRRADGRVSNKGETLGKTPLIAPISPEVPSREDWQEGVLLRRRCHPTWGQIPASERGKKGRAQALMMSAWEEKGSERVRRRRRRRESGCSGSDTGMRGGKKNPSQRCLSSSQQPAQRLRKPARDLRVRAATGATRSSP